MDDLRISENPLYKELKTELQICKIGGLFLALYRDERVIEIILSELKKNLSDFFIFQLEMTSQKVGFPTFFEQTFTQTGRKSNIFHVIGIEALSEKLRSNFIDYLQYTRERFKAKPYSIVFWVTPQFEKQLFLSAPDFHHWISGTYDFSRIELDDYLFLKEVIINKKAQAISIENIEKYLEKVVWQYEHWQEVKNNNEEFLIESMGRANLHDYYVSSYCIDKDGWELLLDDLFDRFLVDKNKNFLTLLGDFGTGKTSFSLHYYIYLAKQFLNERRKRIPIFISLRNYKGELNIEEFMEKEFYERYDIKLSFAIFQELALRGKFVFFVDGFDEMASLADKEMTIKNLKELAKLSFENILFMTTEKSEPPKANKIFLTCRTHYFLTEIQEKEVLKADYTVLYRNYATKSNYEITRIKLKEFNDRQIEEYILKNINNIGRANEYMRIIKDTYNLEELSTRPILLDMIIKTLPGLKDKKSINAANLYRAYTAIWIEREDWRSHMTAEGKRSFMWELALKMFKEGGDFTVHYSKLDKPPAAHLKKDFEILDDDYYRYETTTCSFLNRDKEGNYKFLHKSFMEYFLAEYYFHRIKNNQRKIISPSQLNKETEFFLKILISSEKSNLKDIDLSYLKLDGIDLTAANLYSTNLRGANLTRAELRKANIARANLHESYLMEANLNDANFDGTKLNGANFQGANFQGANLDLTKFKKAKIQGAILQGFDLQEADLTYFDLQDVNLKHANLQGADFLCANLQMADLRKANLQKTNLFKANLKEADLQGANLQGANLKEANLQGANFQWANLRWANLDVNNLREATLHRAFLQGFNFNKADLHGFDLQGVNLQFANLQSANLQRANLFGAKLQKANFYGATLENANLQGVILKEAILRNVNLREAKLNNSYIQRADFQKAKLLGTKFKWADLKEADLRGANLQGAIFFGANLQKADLSDAKNITFEMLLKTKSLYQVKGLYPELEKRLREEKPELFEDPGE